MLGLFPLALLDALKLALAMKHIKTHGDRVDGLLWSAIIASQRY
jgi:hypothetical protein